MPRNRLCVDNRCLKAIAIEKVVVQTLTLLDNPEQQDLHSDVATGGDCATNYGGQKGPNFRAGSERV